MWIEETKLHKELRDTCNKNVTSMDSVSNVSAKQRSDRSSGRSSSQSFVSSATSARLREEANRTTLVAKAAALKEKQALALKEAQLAADKEQLEIETELAASNARIKVYAEFESPQQQVSLAAKSNTDVQCTWRLCTLWTLTRV